MGLFSKKQNNPLDNFSKDIKDLGNITDLRKINPQDIQKLNALYCDDLERKKKEFNFKIQRVCIYFCISIVGLFYLVLFLAIFGVINNQTLVDYFEESIMILVSSVVGFALGYFYSRNV